MREISFDTETTGLDPKRGDRVVEIGCVEMVSHVRTGKTFHVYINPERDMPAQAEAVHGLSIEFLSDKPVFKDIAQSFVDFVGDAKLVAHNASFDMKFINHELVQAGFHAFPATQSIDTLIIARKKYPGQPASLDALCRRFNIDLSVRTKHGALLDAELLSDVYLELMGGRQSSFGLAQQREEQATAAAQQQVIDFPLRHYEVSEEEQATHRAFIKEHVKEPIWQKYLTDKDSA